MLVFNTYVVVNTYADFQGFQYICCGQYIRGFPEREDFFLRRTACEYAMYKSMYVLCLGMLQSAQKHVCFVYAHV